jgi:hypothetical protein
MRSLRVSTLARFGSAAAVAGLALAGALAPVSAASAATTHPVHKYPSHLFVRDHAVKGSNPQSYVIAGLLRSHLHGLPARTIYLFDKTKGNKIAEIATGKTGAHGVVRFTVTPTVRTRYVLVFKGGPRHRRTHSAVIVLRAPKA